MQGVDELYERLGDMQERLEDISRAEEEAAAQQQEMIEQMTQDTQAMQMGVRAIINTLNDMGASTQAVVGLIESLATGNAFGMIQAGIVLATDAIKDHNERIKESREAYAELNVEYKTTLDILTEIEKRQNAARFDPSKDLTGRAEDIGRGSRTEDNSWASTLYNWNPFRRAGERIGEMIGGGSLGDREREDLEMGRGALATEQGNRRAAEVRHIEYVEELERKRREEEFRALEEAGTADAERAAARIKEREDKAFESFMEKWDKMGEDIQEAELKAMERTLDQNKRFGRNIGGGKKLPEEPEFRSGFESMEDAYFRIAAGAAGGSEESKEIREFKEKSLEQTEKTNTLLDTNNTIQSAIKSRLEGMESGLA